MKMRELTTLMVFAVIASMAMATMDGFGIYNGGGWLLSDSAAAPAVNHNSTFGGPGWRPTTGDWNGNGQDGLAVFDTTSGGWLFSQSPLPGQEAVDFTTTFGGGAGSNYIPLAGDWDGDGVDGIAVFDAAGGTWLFSNSATSPSVDYSFPYGGPGYLPAAGDWDGDGKDGIGVIHVASGGWIFDNTVDDNAGTVDFTVAFGGPGWEVTAGDWDGDGIDGIGAMHTSGQFLFSNIAGSGAVDYSTTFGGAGWIPVGGTWVPEPATMTMLLLGGLVLRRRKK